MRRLGKGNSTNRRRSQARIHQLHSRIESWASTTVGAITTPAISVSGTSRATVIVLYIDNAADWNGDATTYSLNSADVVNETVAASATVNIAFANDLGTIGALRAISTANQNWLSLVGGSSGETVSITGDLTHTGYESVELTGSVTYS